MKTYVKPEIYFESFELSQNIAACDWELNNNDVSACTSDGGGYTRFSSGNENCEAEDVYCYTGNQADTGKTHTS